ncbi:MAG: 50S ribosomal protein L12 [Promethearchaeota archaeon]
MESIYAALLLHKVGGKITEANVEKVLTAAGAKVDKSEITRLITGLKQTKIDDIIKSVGVMSVTAAPTGKKKEKKKRNQQVLDHYFKNIIFLIFYFINFFYLPL